MGLRVSTASKTASIIDVTDVIYVCGTIEKQGFVVFPRGAARIAGSIPVLSSNLLLSLGMRPLHRHKKTLTM